MKVILALCLILTMLSCSKKKLTLNEIIDAEIGMELTSEHVWYEQDKHYTDAAIKSLNTERRATPFQLQQMQQDYAAGKIISTSDTNVTEQFGKENFVRVGLLMIAGNKLKKDRINFAPMESASKRICSGFLQLNQEKFVFSKEHEKELKILRDYFAYYSFKVRGNLGYTSSLARGIQEELKPLGILANIKPACDYLLAIK